MKVTVGVAQACSDQFNIDKTISKMRKFAEDAKAKGCEFLVFPEAFVGGYPKFSPFGTRVGERDLKGRDQFLAYHNGAISVPSQTTDQIAQIAKENGMSIIVGVIERDGGTLYCTALYIDREVGYLAKHRKLMPTGAERLIWGFGDATTIAAHSLSIGANEVKTCATICWENYMPLLRYSYYEQGIQLYCAPTVDDRDSWIPTMLHIAAESRTFVLSACQFAQVKDFPDDHFEGEGRSQEDVILKGGSCIVGPLGQMLAGPLRDEEGVLCAEVELDDIVRGRFDMDVVGHYSRNDIFNLVVRDQS